MPYLTNHKQASKHTTANQPTEHSQNKGGSLMPPNAQKALQLKADVANYSRSGIAQMQAFQTQLMNSPEGQRVQQLKSIISNSPQVQKTAQLQAMANDAMMQSQKPVQRVGKEEEILQGKFSTKPVQRVGKEEEMLQGKFSIKPVQRVKEEEMLQGKFSTKPVQRVGKEEEILQGKFSTKPVQRVGKEEEMLQGKFSTKPVQKQENAASTTSSSNNTGLPDNLKSGIESLSGYSMDDVKVHYNSDKPAQLQAHAYAQGTDIHLGSGQEQHLPHEAWHVVQQKQERVKPTLQMKGKVNINDDKGLEQEADVMGAKANNLQLKAKKDTPTTTTSSASNSVKQMVFAPHIVIGNTHLRKVKGSKLYSSLLGKKKIGDKIKVDEEIEVDMAVSYGEGFVKAKVNGMEGAIRASKIVTKKMMTPSEIAEEDEGAPSSDKLAKAEKGLNFVNTVAGKEGQVFKSLGYKKKEIEKKGKTKLSKDYEDKEANEVSKIAESVSSGTGAALDFVTMINKARELSELLKSNSWKWDKAAKLGLSVAVKASSTAGNVSSTVSMVDKYMTGKSKDSKNSADELSSVFGKITGSLKVLKNTIGIISSAIKIWKKGGKENFAKFIKSIASLGGSIMKVLAKFKVIDKTGKFFSGSVPFLSSIVNGAEAVLGFIKMGESQVQAEELSPKSALLRNDIVGILGGGNSNALTGKKGDKSKVFHYEKRGMMFYRKQYARLNPSIIQGISFLHKHATYLVGKAKKDILAKQKSLYNNSGVLAKGDLMIMRSLITKDMTLEELELDMYKRINSGYFKYEESEQAAIDLVLFINKKKKNVSGILTKTADNANSNPVIRQNLVKLAEDANNQGKLTKLKQKLLEYELVDKLVEINHKRKSVGQDDMITAIINVIADTTGAISGFISAGAGILAGKAISGATSAYTGARSGAKFFQKKFRKKGWFGADNSRSGKAKHAEYVGHAKFLTTMWITEAKKANLDEAKGQLTEENLPDGLKRIQAYIEAAGLKVKDLVELPAMKIPDAIVEALKER